MQQLPFYIKVEGHAFSGHRDPQGIYRFDVLEEKSVKHSAYSALEAAKEYVPFLSENPENFTLKAFDETGREIKVLRPLILKHSDKVCYCGRAIDYPPVITEDDF